MLEINKAKITLYVFILVLIDVAEVQRPDLEDSKYAQVH